MSESKSSQAQKKKLDQEAFLEAPPVEYVKFFRNCFDAIMAPQVSDADAGKAIRLAVRFWDTKEMPESTDENFMALLIARPLLDQIRISTGANYRQTLKNTLNAYKKSGIEISYSSKTPTAQLEELVRSAAQQAEERKALQERLAAQQAEEEKQEKADERARRKAEKERQAAEERRKDEQQKFDQERQAQRDEEERRQRREENKQRAREAFYTFRNKVRALTDGQNRLDYLEPFVEEIEDEAEAQRARAHLAAADAAEREMPEDINPRESSSETIDDFATRSRLWIEKHNASVSAALNYFCKNPQLRENIL
jgi:hypothetical protein